MDTLTVLSLAIGIAGLAGTIFFGLKSAKLRRRIKRFDWRDVEVGVRYLNREIFKRFKPDLIFTISAPGAIVSNLLITERSQIIPLYAGITVKPESEDALIASGYKHIVSTAKWRIAVPDPVLRSKDRNILILDAAVISGDAMHGLLKLFSDEGFDMDKIFAATLIATDVALSSKKFAVLHWVTVPDQHVDMPWGKLIGPGYS